MQPPSSVARQFGKAVRVVRLKRKMTQQDLADACGLDIGYIGQIERGLRNPTLGVIGSIAEVLEVKTSALFRAAKL